MHKWTNDERMMIACCNDGPVIFRIERVDILKIRLTIWRYIAILNIVHIEVMR